jgi:hypothetical protein
MELGGSQVSFGHESGNRYFQRPCHELLRVVWKYNITVGQTSLEPAFCKSKAGAREVLYKTSSSPFGIYSINIP